MNLDDIRILLVEDSPLDARLLRQTVRESTAGALHLEHAETLHSALRSLSEGQFDVILLDLSLPDANGLETVAAVHGHVPKIPIVVLTSLDDEALAIRAVRAGAQDYLIKGRVSGDLLVRAVRYACERARAVEALERREEHYRSLIENSLDLVSILKVDGTIRYASPSHERALGYKVDELIGNNAFEFVHADDRAKVRAMARHNAEGGTEYRFRHKDGSFRTLESFGRDLSHVPGVGGVVVNSRDVTDRKRLEEQLHHSQRMEAMGRLAGAVAHDFNNLLMVITGHSQMLLDSMAPADPTWDDLEQVVKAAQRATDLTSQLLAFSRRQSVKPKLLNLNLLVQNAERMLRRVLGESIQLVFALDSGLRPIYADPGQLEQVILNLALNARDAMAGSGTLIVETANDVKGRDRTNCVLFAMKDTGAGISPEVRPHLFEPFFTTKERGTGLGLSTSYGIVKQAGGEIEVESEPGAGATFRICFPAAEPAAEQQEPAPRSEPARGWETILLVENEEGVRQVVETMLKRNGYRVLSSGSTDDALAMARQHDGTIHLLITAISATNGNHIADRLAGDRPEMRVLYVSSNGDTASVDQGAYLQKPFSTSELALKVREVLTATR